MNRPVFFGAVLAALFALGVSAAAPAEIDPGALAEQELAAETRGDVAAALALYSEDAMVQYGGLCWTPCVGKAAIQKELERRVEARNRWKIIGKYVSGNVAVVQTELQIGFIDAGGSFTRRRATRSRLPPWSASAPTRRRRALSSGRG